MSTDNNNEKNEYFVEQPMPTHNDYPASWDVVMEKFRQRDNVGLIRYKTRLQPFNGRNGLRDFTDELYDALVYSETFQIELKRLGKDLQKLLTDLQAAQKEGEFSYFIDLLQSILSRNPVLVAE